MYENNTRSTITRRERVEEQFCSPITRRERVDEEVRINWSDF